MEPRMIYYTYLNNWMSVTDFKVAYYYLNVLKRLK